MNKKKLKCHPNGYVEFIAVKNFYYKKHVFFIFFCNSLMNFLSVLKNVPLENVCLLIQHFQIFTKSLKSLIVF